MIYIKRGKKVEITYNQGITFTGQYMGIGHTEDGKEVHKIYSEWFGNTTGYFNLHITENQEWRIKEI